MKTSISISELYKYYTQSGGVSIDTRTIAPSDMFFALKGSNFDGHKYITKAFESGAKYAVIDDINYKHILNTFLVDNVEKALQDLARYHRLQLNIPVLGLTGSNGKTTTKELMGAALAEEYNVFFTKGNFNNHLGVPLSILSITAEHEIAIIEMGANHPKEIQFLSEIAMPDLGLITNIGKAHLEGFINIEGVRKAKTELYEYIRKVDGIIFYNEKDENLVKSIKSNDKTIAYNPDEMSIVSEFPYLEISYKDHKFTTGLSGGYNATNMLAAITVGEHLNISTEKISKGLAKFSSNNNRSQIKDTQNNKLILDAYNANPSSMRVSINNLLNAKVENKVLILGHMLELGNLSAQEHKDLVTFISKSSCKKVILVGSEFSGIPLNSNQFHFQTTEEAEKYIVKNPIIQCTILLKGSRGIALEKLIPFL